MKQLLQYTVIIILVVIAVTLGYAIYQKLPQEYKLPKKQMVNQLALRTDLTADERLALNISRNDSSIEERKEHFAAVERAARNSDYLDIAGCQTKPVVLKTVKGQLILVRNSDETAHTIVLSKDEVYSIAPLETKEITPLFTKGKGAYGYRCDNSSYGVGLFFAME